MLEIADIGLNWHLSLADGKCIQFIASPRMFPHFVKNFTEADLYHTTVQNESRVDLVGMLVPKQTLIEDLPDLAIGLQLNTPWEKVNQ